MFGDLARRTLVRGSGSTVILRWPLAMTLGAHDEDVLVGMRGDLRARALTWGRLRAAGIAVNSIAPGFTDTPMTRSAPPEMFAAWEKLEPSGKAASPDEIANAVAFLAAPSTTFITGQTLFVDGGKSLGGLGI